MQIDYGKLSLFFGKNFVKVKFLSKRWSDEIFFGESKFFIIPHYSAISTVENIAMHDLFWKDVDFAEFRLQNFSTKSIFEFR